MMPTVELPANPPVKDQEYFLYQIAEEANEPEISYRKIEVEESVYDPTIASEHSDADTVTEVVKLEEPRIAWLNKV